MSHTATLHVHHSAPHTGASVVVAALLLVWAGLIVGFGAAEAFVASPGTPPLRLLVAVMGPIITALIAHRVSPAVREFAALADLRFLTATQAWRFGGFAFLALPRRGCSRAWRETQTSPEAGHS